jgi:adhesin/invasin
LNFSLNKINKDKSFISDEMFEKADVTDQKYNKVRRDNIMVKSGANFTVKAGGF